MDFGRLDEILEGFRSVRVAVLGDFFLDQYWLVEPDLTEESLETGLPAHQVGEVQISPGAAGTVVNNLVAMGAGEILAIGFVGRDGHGWELEHRLTEQGVRTEGLFSTPLRKTPVYTKPMFRGSEGSRFDIKNRAPTPPEVERALIASLEAAAESVDAVSILDQVQEEDCGAVTREVRRALTTLALRYPARPFLADSRVRIGEFRNVMLKPNRREALAAFPSCATEREAVRRLWNHSRRPVFLTRGQEGILVFDENRSAAVAAPRLTEPLDPVGAGDSCSAAMILALATGANPLEAAQLGVLAASVTIRKIGTTGTANPDEIRETARRFGC